MTTKTNRGSVWNMVAAALALYCPAALLGSVLLDRLSLGEWNPALIRSVALSIVLAMICIAIIIACRWRTGPTEESH
jgi:hypothetical protein